MLSLKKFLLSIFCLCFFISASGAQTNSGGQIYDPTAVIKTVKNGKKIGFFYVQMNAATKTVKFYVDKKCLQLVGEYNLGEQYWVSWEELFLNPATVDLKPFYKKIDLKRTILCRTKDGTLIGVMSMGAASKNSGMKTDSGTQGSLHVRDDITAEAKEVATTVTSTYGTTEDTNKISGTSQETLSANTIFSTTGVVATNKPSANQSNTNTASGNNGAATSTTTTGTASGQSNNANCVGNECDVTVPATTTSATSSTTASASTASTASIANSSSNATTTATNSSNNSGSSNTSSSNSSASTTVAPTGANCVGENCESSAAGTTGVRQVNFTQPSEKNGIQFIPTKRPAARADYSAIDNYVKGLNISTSTAIKDAAKTITKKSNTDKEKARAIFTWLAYNVAYDCPAAKSPNSQGDAYTANGTFKNRKGVCQGYSLLFKAMGEAVGLNVEYVSGNNKRNSYVIGASLGNHGWNYVHSAQGDILIDATWGAGNTVNDTFTQAFKPYWFDVDPAYMILSHYPKDSKFQNISHPLSYEQFLQLPRIEPSFANLGIDGKELLEFLYSHTRAWTPDFYGYLGTLANGTLQVKNIPMTDIINCTGSYRFDIAENTGGSLYIKCDFMSSRLTVDNKSYEFSKYKSSAESTMPMFHNGKAVIYYTFSPSKNGTGAKRTDISKLGGTSTSTASASQTVQPAPAATQARDPELYYKDNLSKTQFTLLDGSKADNQANGKTKVLVFFKTSCGNCRNTTRTMGNVHDKFKGVDLLEVEVNKSSTDAVQQYADTYDSSKKIKFAYGSDTVNNSQMWSYLRASGYSKNSITLPVIVYIDKNNKFQYLENGGGLTADKILARIAKVEAAAGAAQ